MYIATKSQALESLLFGHDKFPKVLDCPRLKFEIDMQRIFQIYVLYRKYNKNIHTAKI